MDKVNGDLRGLILDFDGTIAETERFGQRVAYNLAFTELGLDWNWNEDIYGDLLSVAGGKERLRYYLEQYHPQLCNQAGTTELIADIHRVKIQHFAKIAPTIPLRSGIMRLIEQAHSAGLAIAIATTASKPGVEALLSQHERLPPLINLIAANEAVERKKPAPDVYLWALERLGLSAGNCIAIEDSNVGLRAALAAKLPTIITVSDYTARDDFSGASAVLSDLGDINKPALLIDGLHPANGLVDVAFLQAVRVSAHAST